MPENSASVRLPGSGRYLVSPVGPERPRLIVGALNFCVARSSRTTLATRFCQTEYPR
jgi:hypothetical protein